VARVRFSNRHSQNVVIGVRLEPFDASVRFGCRD